MGRLVWLLERIGEEAVDMARFAVEEMPAHLALAAIAFSVMVVGVGLMVFG